jgi:hypothetical protein
VLKVLTDLSQHDFESLPILKVECSTWPSTAHLLRDLYCLDNKPQFRSCLTGRDGGNHLDFIAAWCTLESNPRADIHRRGQTPYSAWGVKASPTGLLSCGFQLPDVLLDPTVFVSPVGNGDELSTQDRNEAPLFHFIMTPAATITDIHDDGGLSASWLVQLYGTKVLFSWPGTELNRKHFKDSHAREHGLRVREAIENLEGFKLNILNPGNAVRIDPGMIHAVVSPTNSAIGCWEYVDAKWLDSNDIREEAEWLLGLIRDREHQVTGDDTPRNMYAGVTYGLNLWRCLLENLIHAGNEEREDHLVKVRDLVKWLEGKIPAKYRDRSDCRATENPGGRKSTKRCRRN